MISPWVSGCMFCLLFQQFIIYCALYTLRPSNAQALKLPVIFMCAYARPWALLIITVSPSFYIADTTLRFLSSSHLFASVPLSNCVSNHSQVNPRHVTVPVNLLCVVLSLNTSLMSQSSTFTTCLIVQPCAEIFREYPLTYLLNTYNCTSQKL